MNSRSQITSADRPTGAALNGIKSGFTGADPDGFFDRRYKNLAIADAPGLCGRANGGDRLFDKVIGQYDFDFHLGENRNRIAR